MSRTRTGVRQSRVLSALVLSALVLSALVLSGCAAEVVPAAKPSWAAVDPPEVAVTDEVRVDGTDLEDGTYWADVRPVSGSDAVVFRVTRVRFGDACERWAAETLRENACLNDYGVEEYPEAFVSLSPYARVSVARPEAPGANLLVDAATLGHLVAGDIVVLPDGYEWVPFPFVVTVTEGTVAEAHQFWVP